MAVQLYLGRESESIKEEKIVNYIWINLTPASSNISRESSSA